MSTGNSQKTQSINLTFDGGMDQRTHPRQTQAPTVLEAVNVRYPQLGGVEKRPGLRNLGGLFRDGYSLVPGQGKLIGFQNELLVTDKFQIGSRSIAGGTEWFAQKGKIPEATSKLKPIDSTQYQLVAPDVGKSSDGLLFHAWLGGGANNASILGASNLNSIFATVEDIATGALLSASVRVSDHSHTWWTPQLAVSGNDAYIFWTETIVGAVTLNIYYSRWNRTTMTWGAQTLLLSGTSQFAIACTDNYIYMMFIQVGSLKVRRYDHNLGVVATTTIAVSTGIFQIGFGLDVLPDDSITWGTYSSDSGSGSTFIWGFTLDASAALASGPNNLYTIAGASGGIQTSPVNIGNGFALVCIQAPGALLCPVYNAAGVIVGNASPANRTTYWSALASKPFVDQSNANNPLRVYAFLNVGSAGAGAPGTAGTQPIPTPLSYTHMMVEILGDSTSNAAWAPRPITWQAPRFTIQLGLGSVGFTLWPPTSVASLGNNQFATDAVIIRNNNGRVSLATHIVDFSGRDRMVSCQLGQTLIASPGFYWDKSKMSEISFAYYPQVLGADQVTTGGSLTADTYLYKAIYEYVDANGFVHQSAPSDPVQVVTTGSTSVITLHVPCLDITQRQMPGADDTGVRIVIYRQRLGAGTGQFIRLFAQGADYLNDSTKKFIDIVDAGIAPTSSTFNEELYADSGVFPNVMPSAFTSCVTYRNRIWIAYGHTVNYSKAFVTGSTVNFTDAFELPLEETGDITAMWVMDDTLYISTADRIYYLYADGPNDFGQQGDVNTPNRVATDFGVIDQRSVVVTQVGTLFQSHAGIQLLTRQRNVAPEPVGSRVQKDLAAFPEIVAANLHPDGRIVTFDCRSQAGAGIRLVYDYSTDRWARDSLFFGQSSGAQILSEAVAGGVQYTLIAGAGATPNKVYAEDKTTNLDDGAWVTMLINMGEVHPLGLQGNISFLKWTMAHEKKSAYDLLVQWFKDYEVGPYQSVSLTDAQLTMMPAYQFSFDTSIHRAQSMRLSLRDIQPAGALGIGKGAAWIGLAVELDPLDNKTFKLAASQKG